MDGRAWINGRGYIGVRLRAVLEFYAHRGAGFGSGIVNYVVDIVNSFLPAGGVRLIESSGDANSVFLRYRKTPLGQFLNKCCGSSYPKFLKRLSGSILESIIEHIISTHEITSSIVMGLGNRDFVCWSDSKGILFGGELLDGTRTNCGDTSVLYFGDKGASNIRLGPLEDKVFDTTFLVLQRIPMGTEPM